MAAEKVKLSRAEALEKRESNLIKQLDEVRQRRALMQVAGADRKITDRKKFLIGGAILKGVADGAKVPSAALEWVKSQISEARDKALFDLPLDDDERAALALAEQRRAVRAAAAGSASPSSGAKPDGEAPTGGDGSQG